MHNPDIETEVGEDDEDEVATQSKPAKKTVVKAAKKLAKKATGGKKLVAVARTNGPGTGRRGPTGATGMTSVKIPSELYERAKSHIHVLAKEILSSTKMEVQVRPQTVVARALQDYFERQDVKKKSA